jgi:hypothetical protein
MNTFFEINTSDTLKIFGYKFGKNGAHSARTMMFGELVTLFSSLPANASKVEYVDAIIDGNLLNKPSKKARQLTARHLIDLYSLDLSIPIFRAFRQLWERDKEARPLLALCIALVRDPLLRGSVDLISKKKIGEQVMRTEVEEILSIQNPDRFSPTSLKSFAQNINGTWTDAGYLKGKAIKLRSLPVVTPTNLTYCLFLGHLEKLSGQRLFNSRWTNLLALTVDELTNLATAAAHRGQIVFMNAGGIKEVRFDGFLTAEEEALLHE